MPPILVAGATGLLGGTIARKLLAAGFEVRALGRNREKLADLERLGVRALAIDMTDARAMRLACEGVGQIVATANNILGSGPSSPLKVDVLAYECLCEAAKAAHVQRIVYVSFRGATVDSEVDFFRVKFAVERVVATCGVPHVIVRPSAFMDIWREVLFGKSPRPSAATLFGGGRTLVNFIAVDDVAEYIVAIVARPEVVNKVIELGGPTNATFSQFAAIVERTLGTRLKRRAIPTSILRFGRHLVRPVHEVAARMMSMGYWTTLQDRPLEDWQGPAARFGVEPRSLEQFVRETFTER